MNVPIAIKQTVAWQVARTMYWLVRGESPERKSARYDQETNAVMRQALRPGTIGVDVGANEGNILRQMVTMASAARHIAIEPLPGYAAALRSEFPNVTIIQAALSDQAGSAVFHHVVSSPWESGLVRLQHYHRDGSVIEEIKVDVFRLDDVVPQEETVSFLKIDTEGAELAVIRGAQETIRRCRPVIVFEAGARTTGCYGVSAEDIMDTIGGLGLSLSTMSRWLHGWRAFTGPQFREAYANRDFYFIAYYGGGPGPG
jgi:FkbM family methyltransferase